LGLALLATLVVVGVYVVVGYNGLTRLRLLADNAWSDIDVQLKRRHDLIPSLVATVQGHAGYEKSTLEAVITARNRAMAASGPAAMAPAEADIAGAVKHILALAEAYPDLKAGESFLSLQRNLTEIEEQVQQARRYYNAVVRDLNTSIAQFPSNLIAGAFRIAPREFFGLDTPAESATPRIELGP